MGEHRSRTLWIAAAVATVLTVAAVVVDPNDFGRTEESDELDSTIEKAATYYEFEHYDRAAETYAIAAEAGMQDGVEWYRYARSVEMSAEIDLQLYVTAYRQLLAQTPTHEYLAETEGVLSEYAVQFSYTLAEDGSHEEGSLMVAVGTVFRVRRGRISGGTDDLFVDTKPNRWFGYMGEPIRIIAPRDAGYQSGDNVTAIGWYDGWCEISDNAGMSTRYPCLIAAGVATER